MSARWRLPDTLGGGVYNQYPQADAPGGTVGLLVDEHLVFVATGLLTRVLPDEPPVGSIVAAGYPDNPLPLYRRWDEGWSRVGDLQDGSEWAEICALSMERSGVAPRLLVPAPEPVELPWQLFDGVKVAPLVGCGCFEGQEDGVRMVRVEMDAPTNLLPGEAREFAWALLAAADAAGAAS